MGVLLQEQSAWPLCISRVLFDKYALCQPSNNLSCSQSVIGKLIVSMFGDSNFARRDQSANFFRKRFQPLPRSADLESRNSS